jgi:hypothetical protein
MRRFILIAAMVLASASAQAGPSRSLILASNDEQPVSAPQTTPAPAAGTTTTAPQTATTTETPKYVERPAAVTPATATPATTTTEPPKTTKAADSKADKAKKRRETEARVINELHRHGIYW